jgi:hypothetical protein
LFQIFSSFQTKKFQAQFPEELKDNLHGDSRGDRHENCSKKRVEPELHRHFGSDSMSFDFGQPFHPSLLKQEAIGDEHPTG